MASTNRGDLDRYAFLVVASRVYTPNRIRCVRLRLRSEPSLSPNGTPAGFAEEYQGERHSVPVNCSPTGSPFIEWCEFEEREGSAPKEKLRHSGGGAR